ncbi:MAG: ABC transporter permease [Chloroflexi bacterium]|nr:ABC transporter permease [Chloroflexota bacterium]MYF21862.1 ABC transporter permease [Chloroflexota bacterium]
MSARPLRKELLVSVAAPLGLVLVVLVGWQAYVWLSDIRPQTLPGPLRVVRESVESAGAIWEHSLVTMTEVAAGFAISIACAIALGLLLDLSSALRRSFYPLIVASQAVPIPVVAPLMIVWFGFGVTPKIIVIGLFTFVPIVLGFAAGLAATERPATDLMRTFGATRWQMYRYVKIPAALPDLFTGLRIAAIYAVLGAIFGELAGATEGLGIFLEQSRLSFRTDLVFGAIFVVTIMSYALFLAVVLLERRAIPWRFLRRAP